MNSGFLLLISQAPRSFSYGALVQYSCEEIEIQNSVHKEASIEQLELGSFITAVHLVMFSLRDRSPEFSIFPSLPSLPTVRAITQITQVKSSRIILKLQAHSVDLECSVWMGPIQVNNNCREISKFIRDFHRVKPNGPDRVDYFIK